MEQRIIHACGHEQGHYLTGYDSQQERKAKWLKTSSATISHLDLPLLTGTDRQISWASTIRTKRLAALTNSNSAPDYNACLRVADAKWWIDCRDLTDVDLMAAANKASNIPRVPTPMPSTTNPTIAL
jgi:hypothetical protein